MKITSHFIAIELKSEIFESLYSKIQVFLSKNKIEDILVFQNIDSIHITLYYLDNKLDLQNRNDIKKFIWNINIKENIFINEFKYFYRENKKFLLYLKPKSKIDFLDKRNILDMEFKNNSAINNDLEFISHITFFKILNFEKYSVYKTYIEKIIYKELNKIKIKNISTKKLYLYAADSSFREELQIKI